MGERFQTTNWRLVLQARVDDAPDAGEALALLCQSYWYPIYGFIRRRGYSVADAEDLTQAYFARFLEKDYLQGVSPEAGRFRSFLLASVRHFLSNERDRSRALKRGGGHKPIALDGGVAEERYRSEPADAETPETIFERNWATAVLERVLALLESEMANTEGAERFRRLRPWLTGDEPDAGYSELAGSLGVTESAVRVAVHRLRKRFGALLREEIGRTVGGPDEVEQEIRHLLAAVARRTVG
jgi:RNA polymerase sigma-70 factor (ECF subfamily)